MNQKTHLGLLITVLVLIASSAMAAPPPAPDAGSTSLLLGVAVMGLATAKRLFRR
jgi:protein with PEP-CTERM/exosortase system signal